LSQQQTASELSLIWNGKHNVIPTLYFGPGMYRGTGPNSGVSVVACLKSIEPIVGYQ